MRILIADDEPLARTRMRRLLEELPQAASLAEAENGQQALKLIGEWQPDVVLLDIRMPGLDGLEVAKRLSHLDHPPAIIFTTAFDSHAIAAFESQATDYLLKPIRKERLQQALAKASRTTRLQLANLPSHGIDNARTHLSATQGGKLRLIPLRDVLYFQAGHKYVSVHHADGEVLIEESLKSLEEEFADRFVRIHRNALVAMAHIAGLDRDEHGQHVVVLRDSAARLEISRRHLPELRARLRQTAHTKP